MNILQFELECITDNKYSIHLNAAHEQALSIGHYCPFWDWESFISSNNKKYSRAASSISLNRTMKLIKHFFIRT